MTPLQSSGGPASAPSAAGHGLAWLRLVARLGFRLLLGFRLDFGLDFHWISGGFLIWLDSGLV